MRIALAADHAGYRIKEAVKKYLEDSGFHYEDFGTDSPEPADYPDFVHPAIRSVVENKYDRAILVCGTGQGTQMVANKYPGIRAALCWNPKIAALSRKHNDANALSMPGRFISGEEAVEIVKVWLNTPFDGGRHARRVGKIESS